MMMVVRMRRRRGMRRRRMISRSIRITLMMMRMGEMRRAVDCDKEDRERW